MQPSRFIVAVTGSRDWEDRSAIRMGLSLAMGDAGMDHGVAPDDITVIHGDCRGADRLAAQIARDEFNLDVRAFPADWHRLGKRAGIVRNLAMLDERPHLVLAFRRNGSRGTTHMIEAAKARGIPVRLFVPAAELGATADAM